MNINTARDFYTGQVTNIGNVTPVVLGASQRLRLGVTVLAPSTNSGTIYVASTSSGANSRDGFPLIAGASIDIKIDDINKVYVVGSASSGNVNYIGA